MYKLLLATESKEIQDMYRDGIDWHRLGFHHPTIAGSAKEAIEALETKPVDAVGYHLGKQEAINLSRYLRYGRPSLPLFEVSGEAEKQLPIFKELLRVLDRLHTDFSDDNYDADTMMTLVRDEITHQVLSGEITDYEQLKRTLSLLRARIDPDRPFALFEIDMPQGEVYMLEHRNHAKERLEAALRNNFFGRYVDDVYYAVAVLTPRHIRLAAVPMLGAPKEEPDAYLRRTREHVDSSFDMIKEYLDLDMAVEKTTVVDGFKSLSALVMKEEE